MGVVTMVIFVVEDLLQVVDQSIEEGKLSWQAKWWASVRRLADAVPMTPIKIILVVWQIVSQVSVQKMNSLPPN